MIVNDEINEELFEYFVSGSFNIDDYITIKGVKIPLKEFVTKNDLNSLSEELNMLLDDDFGDYKHFNIVDNFRIYFTK